LGLVSVLQHFPGASQGLLIHGAIVKGNSEGGQRYEGASCAYSEPVPFDGEPVEIACKKRENEQERAQSPAFRRGSSEKQIRLLKDIY
jgi:hypothetical protein